MAALFKSTCYDRGRTNDVIELAIGWYHLCTTATLEKDTVPADSTKLKYMTFVRDFLQYYTVRRPDKKVRDTTLPYLGEADADDHTDLIVALLKEACVLPLSAVAGAEHTALVKSFIATYKTLDNSQSKAARRGGFAPRIETPTRHIKPFEPVMYSDIPSLDNPVDNPAWAREHATPPADTTAPVLTSCVVKKDTLTLTYDTALKVTKPLSTAYTVYLNGVLDPVIAVVVQDKTVTLTLKKAAVLGDTLTVAYVTDDIETAVQDASGNRAVTFGAKAVTNQTPEAIVPTLVSGTVNNDTVVLTCSEALDTTSIPVTTAFTIKRNNTILPVAHIAIAGVKITITVEATVVSTDTVVLTYTESTPGIQDLVGNKMTSGALTLDNITPVPDTTAPTVTFATIDSAILTMTVDESLDITKVPATTAFSVIVNGNPTTHAVNNVEVKDKSIVLTLATVTEPYTGVSDTDTVTLDYTQSDDGITDTSGNKMDSFIHVSVINDTPAA